MSDGRIDERKARGSRGQRPQPQAGPRRGRLGDAFRPRRTGTYLWNPASTWPATENRLNANFWRPLRPKTAKNQKIGKKQAEMGGKGVFGAFWGCFWGGLGEGAAEGDLGGAGEGEGVEGDLKGVVAGGGDVDGGGDVA